ncbi:putative cytochrome p450 protein [Botrytis cinerea BcDW1]|uniref:Putative cytochrome p450 protein n=1 Tax=Botryotinia fuckeliana (strain BcDW1) TaxID=1290391 RepID=M7UMD3_BOTF1|nr:putative cytochrome p450 protein [Botrytis cinerea BcDW1]
MDDFYQPLTNSTDAIDASKSGGLITNALTVIRSVPLPIVLSIALAPVLLIIATRLLSERPSEKQKGKDGKTVWMPAYWVPGLGHMVALVLQKKESDVAFKTVALGLSAKFFGLPKKAEKVYVDNWEEYTSVFTYLMKEPHLSSMLDKTLRNLEGLIPQMVSFMDSEIDQHPWEKWANAEYISNNEMEVDLMALVRDILGHASVPSLFGREFLDNNPHVLHDIYEMDRGMMYFIMGLPWFTPWPAVARAYYSRSQIQQSMTKFQEALDATVDGKQVDSSYGDLDDVSEFILKRHELFRSKIAKEFNLMATDIMVEHGLKPDERGDISVIWALIVNSTLIVYWHLLYILSTPGLADKIRAEISPYATVTPGEKIGSISEAPHIHLSHEDLSKKCPLFKSTYLEASRLCSQPISLRKLENDITLTDTSSSKETDKTTYMLHKNEYVTLPHDLHMRDPSYFPSPTEFNPERFLTTDETGNISVDPQTIRPYGGGPSMCKGRVYAERECLAFVAGIIMYWDIGAVAKKGEKKGKWTIPKMIKTSAVCLPDKETRVRIKRREV